MTSLGASRRFKFLGALPQNTLHDSLSKYLSIVSSLSTVTNFVETRQQEEKSRKKKEKKKKKKKRHGNVISNQYYRTVKFCNLSL
jgi:hypothetical protein